MNPTIENIIFVFIGWLLALMSTIVIDIKRKYEEAKEVKESIYTELHEYQYRMVITRYFFITKYQKTTRDELKWTVGFLKKYRGVQKFDNILKHIEDLLLLPDEAISLSFENRVHGNKEQTASNIKKYPSAILDAQVSKISWLSIRQQNLLIEIKTNIEMLNQYVDEYKFYYQITFQKISDENHEIIRQNLLDLYKAYSDRAKIIAELIAKLDI